MATERKQVAIVYGNAKVPKKMFFTHDATANVYQVGMEGEVERIEIFQPLRGEVVVEGGGVVPADKNLWCVMSIVQVPGRRAIQEGVIVLNAETPEQAYQRALPYVW